MRGHQVGDEKLLFAHPVVELAVFFLEPLIDLNMRLAHIVQHRVDAVLRSHLELAADVILHQLPEELVIFVLQHIVKPNARADKYLFDPRNAAQTGAAGGDRIE